MGILRSRGAALVLISLLSTAALLLHRIPRLSEPPHIDETDMLLMAQTQQSGGVIYRDQWNSHAPGIYLLLATLPERLLHSNAEVRLVSVAALGAVVFLLSDLCLVLGASLWAVASGAGVFILLNCNTYLQTQWLQTEQIMAALLAALLWALVVRRNAGLAWLLFGAGLMFKQSFVAWAPFLAAMDLMTRNRERTGSLRYWLPRGLVAAPALAAAGYFLLRGALPDFWRCTVVDALHHGQWQSNTTSCDNWYAPLKLLLLGNSRVQTQTLLAGLGGCLAAALALDRKKIFSGPGWLLLSAAGVSLAGGIVFLKIQRCGRIYYLEMLYPGILLLTVWACDWSAARLRANTNPLGRIIGGGGLFVTALGIAILIGTFNAEAPAGEWSERIAVDRDVARLTSARLLSARFPEHRFYNLMNPALYWYGRQTPPKFTWTSELLEFFPSRREEIYADLLEYGRGHKLLILSHRQYFSPMYPETKSFLKRTQDAGAVPFNDGKAVDTRIRLLYELYEWDLTGCGAAPSHCPPGHSSLQPPLH